MEECQADSAIEGCSEVLNPTPAPTAEECLADPALEGCPPTDAECEEDSTLEGCPITSAECLADPETEGCPTWAECEADPDLSGCLDGPYVALMTLNYVETFLLVADGDEVCTAE